MSSARQHQRLSSGSRPSSLLGCFVLPACQLSCSAARPAATFVSFASRSPPISHSLTHAQSQPHPPQPCWSAAAPAARRAASCTFSWSGCRCKSWAVARGTARPQVCTVTNKCSSIIRKAFTLAYKCRGPAVAWALRVWTLPTACVPGTALFGISLPPWQWGPKRTPRWQLHHHACFPETKPFYQPLPVAAAVDSDLRPPAPGGGTPSDDSLEDQAPSQLLQRPRLSDLTCVHCFALLMCLSTVLRCWAELPLP